MKVQDFENLILAELKKVVEAILKKHPEPNISAKSRAGAEISSLLEEQFVLETAKHKYFSKSEASKDGDTKNPWDAITTFTLKGHSEIIWIDFKSIKITSANSNPDIGAVDKTIKLIESGSFYLVYIYTYYEKTDNGLRFVKNVDGEMVKIYFLKDISSTFRRNPKNQLQVNISAKPEHRTRKEFINLLLKKITESHKRQIKISEKELKKLEGDELEKKLIALNNKLEAKIKKIK